MNKTYGLYNANGEIISDVHSVSAENKLDALITMCLRYNHENHDTGYVTDGTEIYEYQGFDPEDDDCMKDFPGFNPDVDPYLNPDKYDTDKFRDKYCLEDSLSVDQCYTLNKDDLEFGCYENEEDAYNAASNDVFNDYEFTIKDPDGNSSRQYSLWIGIKDHVVDADYYSDWFEGDEKALENLKDWMYDYEFDAISEVIGETVGLEDLQGYCRCDVDDRIVGIIDGADLAKELTDKAEQEQVAKPSLADVKKKVADKKEAVDHTEKKTKSNGR